jgi:hypothetical protein
VVSKSLPAVASDAIGFAELNTTSARQGSALIEDDGEDHNARGRLPKADAVSALGLAIQTPTQGRACSFY